MAFKTNDSVTPKLRREMCSRVAKILAYLGCGQTELAKHHAIALQKMLIDMGLLVDVPTRACDNGPHSGK